MKKILPYLAVVALISGGGFLIFKALYKQKPDCTTVPHSAEAAMWAARIWQQGSPAKWKDASVVCHGPCPRSYWFGDPIALGAQKYELHVIGRMDTTPPTGAYRTKTTIQVTSATKPVALFLIGGTNYDWIIDASPGVEIKKVFVNTASSAVELKGEFERINVDEGVAWSKMEEAANNHDKMQAFLNVIKLLTKLEPHSIQYDLGNEARVPISKNLELIKQISCTMQAMDKDFVGEARPVVKETVAEKPAAPKHTNPNYFLRDGRLMGLRAEDRELLADLIPPKIRQIVWSPAEKIYYMAGEDTNDYSLGNMWSMTPKGEVKRVTCLTPDHVKTVDGKNMFSAVAFDDNTQEVIFTSMSGSVVIHAFNSAKKSWTEFENNPMVTADAEALVYHKKTGRMYGIHFPILKEFNSMSMERYIDLEKPDDTFHDYTHEMKQQFEYNSKFITLEDKNGYTIYDDGDEVVVVETFANTQPRYNELNKYKLSKDVARDEVMVYRINPETGKVRSEKVSTKDFPSKSSNP